MCTSLVPVIGYDKSAALYEEAIRRDEGLITAGGALLVTTGEHTGRSPKDKFIVESDSTRGAVDWGGINQPISRELFDTMRARIAAYYHGRDAFVLDCFAGADPAYRLPVRVVTETAWHNLFARNMFIRPEPSQLVGFEPAFTILHAPGLTARGKEDGVNSGTFILVDFDRRIILIGGTWYAGEIKKSIFGVLNYLLPEQGVMPMHCSANVGSKGDVAVFFGLSGTGKTTLSADGTRTLIGDDEHGWSDHGIFNFEGGCYAKVIRLSAEAEPEIWAASHRFGTVLENVVHDPVHRTLLLDDDSLTENTRSCYPIDFIPNTSATGVAGHPVNLVMLTADAFGVLPPISKLTPEQAMYHFLSGYTAPGRRHREGPRQGAAGDLLDLFRRAVHAAPPVGLRRHAARQDRQARRHLLAGQHRLVGRPRRCRRRPHEDRLHPGHGAGGARRAPGRRAGARGRPVRPAGAGGLPGRAERGAAAARRLGRQERLRRHRPRPVRPLRGQLQEVRAVRRRQRQGGRHQEGGLSPGPAALSRRAARPLR